MRIVFLFFCYFWQIFSSEGIIQVDEFFTGIKRRLDGDYTLYKPPLRHHSENLVTIHFSDGRGGVITQQVYDPRHILMNREEFVPALFQKGETRSISGVKIHRPNSGTRAVGIYKNKLCFKLNPEAPGLDKASNLLYQTIFAEMVGNWERTPFQTTKTDTETLVMNGKVFSISKFIEGNKLADVIRSGRNLNQYQYDPVQIAAQIIWSMLVDPEDCRQENCIVHPTGNEDHHIISVDNVRTFFEYVNSSGRGHTVFFSFPEMRKKSPKDLYYSGRRCITGLALERWAEQVRLEHQYLTRLQGYARASSSILGVPITEEYISTIYRRVDKIYQGLGEKKTLIEILKDINPQLADSYKHERYTQYQGLEYVRAHNNDVDGGRNNTRYAPLSAMNIGDYGLDLSASVFRHSNIIERLRGFENKWKPSLYHARHFVNNHVLPGAKGYDYKCHNKVLDWAITSFVDDREYEDAKSPRDAAIISARREFKAADRSLTNNDLKVIADNLSDYMAKGIQILRLKGNHALTNAKLLKKIIIESGIYKTLQYLQLGKTGYSKQDRKMLKDLCPHLK